ncbi:hypothetical protein [Flavobacterium sp. ENC]|uniref:hypothetical protein n=1 Tax=Flavobacterium sp. ENC TaxID=2897330 RepID=UPI001E36A19D|nr:hypothetical protein [Flavobacterium sp. ENC]MCD0465329.1 hypothetical protein [Flavobacterium sp. ENC]
MNQTESGTFDITNNSLDIKHLKIQKEMERLGFYSAQIDANRDKITFDIKGKFWNGKESAENPFVYTCFTFFGATSYPTEVYINAYDD